jgi:tetratricopeptide (TPR) repeat protein
MASLIPGFEYDIFISYRQKDNKGSRWVSEFVDALKTELEATFKEDISIYFDENLHDGLLETYDVNASLRDKLKSLIFIPVISRTYCDPKSYAWEYEFKAFVEQAINDRYGLKIKLPSGNVSSRVLPVKIHDLDPDDNRLCESILGGPLRGIDFIYKSPGVNRPLLSKEDHPGDNLNKTYYRDQINKVANAVNEIVRSLKQDKTETGGEPLPSQKRTGRRRALMETVMPLFSRKKLKRRLSFYLIPLLLLLMAVIIYRSFYLKNREKTLAIIPLRIPDNDTLLKNDGDYFIEAMNDKLNMIKSISLKPTISTMQFRNTEKPLDRIRKELKTNYLIDGNIRRDGDKIKIWIELSAARSKKMLWSKTYTWDKNLVHMITLEVIGAIDTNLDIRLTPEEERRIRTEPSKFPIANLNYISANAILKDAWFYINYGDKLLDSTSFKSAIETYDKVIKEDSMFAIAYAKRATAIAWGIFDKQLDTPNLVKCRSDINKALSLDKNLAETQIALGFYYYYCEVDFDKALFYFTRAADMAPGNYQPLYYQALVYRKLGKWKESQALINRVIHFDPQEALFLTNIGLSFTFLHKYDSALIYHQKAIDLVPGWPAAYKNKIQALLLKTGKTCEARALLDEAIRKTGDNMMKERILLDIFDKNYDGALHKAEESRPGDFMVSGSRFLNLAAISSLLGKPSDAKSYYDSALVILNAESVKDPLNYQIHSLTGIALAALGNKSAAVAEGEKAITLAEKNKMDESEMKINLARIYTLAGDYDNAIVTIAYLLNNPSCLSKRMLQLDPRWKPLMENPEYKEMIRKYSN